jgi:hypothetical protein
MQVVICGLTIPILHDTFHAVTHDFLQYSEIQAQKSKEIEKRNNKLGDKLGTRFATP